MSYLGFRCWPDHFVYVVLDGTAAAPKSITSGRIEIPADSDRPAFLSWISREIKTILTRHNPSRCSYKSIEPLARKNSDLLRRAQVEGVVQAVVHEFGCKAIGSYTKQQLKAKVGFSGTAKEITEALKNSPIREFYKTEFEDAALAAWASLSD